MNPSTLRPYPVPAIDRRDRQRLAWARSAVAEMTAPEKIAQLHQHSPGVERLGIAPFVTGTEALHGVAWRGAATQFAQPVGMAASWDPELLRRAAAVIAGEVRALHEEDPRIGLGVWAPVVNPLRHPLWGRAEEGYSEDPFLNSELACGFSAGLRGDGETWTTLPTLKHFLAYSNETDRDATSSDLSPRVLHEYELPGHVSPLVRGVAGSVMLAYNLVNGRPAHVTELLEDELRARLPDPDLLFVVSDAGAPSNLFRSQKVAADAAEAHAAMLRAGVDSFTDHDSDPTETIAALTAALEQGLIEEAHLDRAVVRQLVARARTGEFEQPVGAADTGRTDPAVLGEEPAAGCASASTSARPGDDHATADRAVADRAATVPGADPGPADESARATAHALAREVATRSAVLLAQHDPAALPLPPGRTAVIGEQAHSVLRDWYSGEFYESTSLAAALEGAPGEREVRTTRALDVISLSASASGAARHQDARSVLLCDDGSLRCPAPAADGPAPVSAAPARFEVLDLGDDVIALRDVGSRTLVAPDDRGRLAASAERIGGWVVQETYRRSVAVDGTWQLQHTGSGRFIGIEHHSGALVLRDHTTRAAARFAVTTHQQGTDAFDAAARGADSVVLVVGNDPHVHGRETEDRTEVRLPAPARTAAERLAALPAEVATVLVITSSYPYDLEGLEDRVGAVVWSSHAGEAEGTALADLLAGRRNFSGRLAQTWPGSSPLPSVLDYDVIATSSTYLYGQEARFPFGHGLSTDRADWGRAGITAGPEGLCAEVTLSAPPSRSTQGPLHEVVQVYADVPPASFSRRRYAVPRTRLVGFSTLEVPAEGTATSRVRIPYGKLALFAPDREAWELPDGPVTLRIARSSADTVHAQELHVPADVLSAAQLPPAAPGLIPASRAEETHRAARCATTLLAGTELRPTGHSAGWADFVVDAGTVITAPELRSLGAPGAVGHPGPAGTSTAPAPRAELVDPTAEDPAAADALPLPHTVPAERSLGRDRPTGRVRVRLAGPAALNGLRTDRP
jgi:beta-glucosidase